MDAHDGEKQIWPAGKSSVIDWMVNDTRSERYIDNIFLEMCERLNAAGVPVTRASLHFRTLHPQWLGARVLWRRGVTEADIDTFGYGVEKTSQFLNSPGHDIFGGAAEVRENLEHPDTSPLKYPLFDELRQEGLTDYIAWPIEHTFDKRHIVTFSTDRPGGFHEAHVAALRDLLPVLALVTEIRLKNILARTFLETYVGPHASEQILAGATTRGSGVTVSAAIMVCDLREFTSLSDLWPRDDVIELLNAYFDALSDPIETNGGEILKFMGDGLLAIFPLSSPTACADLLRAIQEGREAMVRLNVANAKDGRPTLGYGVGVHVGDVMYGNIGSRKRLDFTVIGPAVNIASRLESLTKDMKRSVLLSKAFADMAGDGFDLENLGPVQLRGLEHEIDVFALADRPETRSGV